MIKILKIIKIILYYRMYGIRVPPPYSERLKMFNLTALYTRYSLIDLVTLYKITHQILPSNFSPCFSKLSPNRFLVSPINTSIYRASFFHRSLIQWNKYYSSLDCTSLCSFKQSCLNHLTQSASRA